MLFGMEDDRRQPDVVTCEAVAAWDPEPSVDDRALFLDLVSTELKPGQVERVLTPPVVYPTQRSIMALHWHPEFIPTALIRRRLEAAFPAATTELVVPTDHNVLRVWDGYAGVEVDCYSSGFKRKVQLLVHLHADKVEKAGVFKAMLRHTFGYRARQLLELVDTITHPVHNDRVDVAAAKTGVNPETVEFARYHVRKFRRLLEEFEDSIAPEVLKNRLLRDWMELQQLEYNPRLVSRALVFVSAVKNLVKADLNLDYFYRASNVIEEVRSLGGGIVVPHPEQFWPILLADYDVDGFEVWNPQSREYTDFLIYVVNRENHSRRHYSRPWLIFMGDDAHMSEKVRDPRVQDPHKLTREVGVQPPWEDPEISATLVAAGVTKEKVIAEYAARLA